MLTSHCRWCLTLILIFALAPWATTLAADENAPSASSPHVNVILWFDTEDYLLPADDDAAKRLAEMLTARHIRATFKIVGEKARVLERRGRGDVIAALKQHDIGYHSNLHSVHPAPAEYLADCGLLDGMEEFVRREARGAADVRRIFAVPSLVCYGQPGSSWAPQAIAALKLCGISNDGTPCYLDSGNHIGFGGRPFWYCGVLNVYDMSPNETRMDLYAPGGLEDGEKNFDQIESRLSRAGGGLISIYYHPCEWVHEKFWDAVNFSRGANPPREQWKAEPQRPASETEAAFARFAAYIDHLRASPGVQFVTASQLPKLYPDRATADGATESQINELAQKACAADALGIDDLVIGNKAFSPADQFCLFSSALSAAIHPGDSPGPLPLPAGLLGPDGPPPEHSTLHDPIPWPAFRDAVLDADDFVRQQHRIPARVFIGPDPVAPADFVRAMAHVLAERAKDGRLPDCVALPSGTRLLTADRVIRDGPNVYGGWIIHKQGFRAPHILEIARLQAWTLKPAIAAEASGHGSSR